MSRVPKLLERMVRERAGNRCEYCGLAQVGQEATFHIDQTLIRREEAERGRHPPPV
jgi:hypothetical protein